MRNWRGMEGGYQRGGCMSTMEQRPFSFLRRLAGLVDPDGGLREQALLQRLVVGFGGKGPTEPGGEKPPKVLGDGASGDGAALGDLAFGESTVELQAQHFTDLSHG